MPLLRSTFQFRTRTSPTRKSVRCSLALISETIFLLYRSFYFGLFNLNGLGPNFIAVALVMVVMLQTHKSFNGYLRISLNAAKSFLLQLVTVLVAVSHCS